jgi:hypothetical protein
MAFKADLRCRHEIRYEFTYHTVLALISHFGTLLPAFFGFVFGFSFGPGFALAIFLLLIFTAAYSFVDCRFVFARVQATRIGRIVYIPAGCPSSRGEY